MLRAFRDRALFATLGHSTRVVSVYWLNNVQISLNYLPLKAGTISSAEFFRSRFRVPYGDFAVFLAQRYLVTILVASLFAAAALLAREGGPSGGAVPFGAVVVFLG